MFKSVFLGSFSSFSSTFEIYNEQELEPLFNTGKNKNFFNKSFSLMLFHIELTDVITENSIIDNQEYFQKDLQNDLDISTGKVGDKFKSKVLIFLPISDECDVEIPDHKNAIKKHDNRDKGNSLCLFLLCVGCFTFIIGIVLEKNPQIVNFLVDLLYNPFTNPSIIKWEDYENGKFRFIDPNKVSKLWGTRSFKKIKDKEMDFGKFSRAIRYIYAILNLLLKQQLFILSRNK